MQQRKRDFLLKQGRLPIFATVIFDEKGKLLTGGDVSSTVALLEGLGVDVLGINCGLGPVQMKGIVEELLSVSSTPGVGKSQCRPSKKRERGNGL